MDTSHKTDEKSRYMDWKLYDEPPEGFTIDKNTGSPLSGYDFFTNGKSVLNGQKRILVKAIASPACSKQSDNRFIDELKVKNKEPKQNPVKDRKARQKINVLARNKFKIKLLEEIQFDLMVCELEGWDAKDYINELKSLIDDVYRKMIKKKKRSIDTINEFELKFDN